MIHNGTEKENPNYSPNTTRINYYHISISNTKPQACWPNQPHYQNSSLWCCFKSNSSSSNHLQKESNYHHNHPIIRWKTSVAHRPPLLQVWFLHRRRSPQYMDRICPLRVIHWIIITIITQLAAQIVTATTIVTIIILSPYHHQQTIQPQQTLRTKVISRLKYPYTQLVIPH